MSLLEKLSSLEQEITERISQADSLASLKELEIKYLGRKGPLNEIMKGLGGVAPKDRKAVGQKANAARKAIQALFADSASHYETGTRTAGLDPTRPGTHQRLGAAHIVNQTMSSLCQTFHGMGFEIAHGPDIETDYYNFEALNFPPDHPARDMQDTFFVDGGRLLRTHTTPVQARELERRKPPIKVIMPGKTFRNEEITTRSHVSFHQVDGFMVGERISMADLKAVLRAFTSAYFGPDLKLKFRPSFFPFTEPSMEVDIQCWLGEEGKGCQLCKYTGWLEILGCGMIHPNVLETAGIDSERYTGYAFGIGVERIAMLRHGITDIRYLFNNNTRFLRQFV